MKTYSVAVEGSIIVEAENDEQAVANARNVLAETDLDLQPVTSGVAEIAQY